MKDKYLLNEVSRHLTTIANQRMKIEQMEARINALRVLVDQINADRDELRDTVKSLVSELGRISPFTYLQVKQ